MSGDLGMVAENDDPAQRRGIRRDLERDLEVCYVHREQARSGLREDGGQVPCRGTGLERNAHRTRADARQIHHGVLGAWGTENRDEVTGAHGVVGVVAPLGGHRGDTFPQFAIGECVEPFQEAQRGAARVRVCDRLRGTLAQGGAVCVSLHHCGHEVGKR